MHPESCQAGLKRSFYCFAKVIYASTLNGMEGPDPWKNKERGELKVRNLRRWMLYIE